jgi:hypothetical protein
MTTNNTRLANIKRGLEECDRNTRGQVLPLLLKKIVSDFVSLYVCI